jgi:tetratricopeptide (TPR) repeat protein
LRFFSLALDHLFWQRDPFGYHLTNLFLHATVTGLVFVLLNRFLRHPAAAALATLIWALHPVQTDSVTYISGRRDLLCCLFFLWAYLSWPRRWPQGKTARSLLKSVFSLLLFGLAFESKEMAVTMPIVLALERRYFFKTPLYRSSADEPLSSPKQHTWRVIPVILLALLAIIAGIYKGLINPETYEINRLWGGSLTNHIMTILAAYSKYLEWIIAPFNLYGDYSGFPIADSFTDPRVWSGLFFLAIIWIGGFVLRKRVPSLSFGLLWFGITLLPVSHIIPHHELLAEHYLYIPLIGLAIPLGHFIKDGLSGDRSRHLKIALCCLCVAYALKIQDRNRDFETEERFSTAVLEHDPGSIRGHLHLAHAYQRSDRLDEASEIFQWILSEAEPHHRYVIETEQSLLVTYSSLGNFEGVETLAEEILNRALIHPAHRAYTCRILGTIRAQQGRLEEAVDLLETSLALAPLIEHTHLHLGVTLLKMYGRNGDPSFIHRAQTHLEFSAAHLSDDIDAQFQWATIAMIQQSWEIARERLQHVLQMDPGFVPAIEQMVLLHQQLREPEEFCYYYWQLRDLREDIQALDAPCPRPEHINQ